MPLIRAKMGQSQVAPLTGVYRIKCILFVLTRRFGPRHRGRGKALHEARQHNILTFDGPNVLGFLDPPRGHLDGERGRVLGATCGVRGRAGVIAPVPELQPADDEGARVGVVGPDADLGEVQRVRTVLVPQEVDGQVSV